MEAFNRARRAIALRGRRSKTRTEVRQTKTTTYEPIWAQTTKKVVEKKVVTSAPLQSPPYATAEQVITKTEVSSFPRPAQTVTKVVTSAPFQNPSCATTEQQVIKKTEVTALPAPVQTVTKVVTSEPLQIPSCATTDQVVTKTEVSSLPAPVQTVTKVVTSEPLQIPSFNTAEQVLTKTEVSSLPAPVKTVSKVVTSEPLQIPSCATTAEQVITKTEVSSLPAPVQTVSKVVTSEPLQIPSCATTAEHVITKTEVSSSPEPVHTVVNLFERQSDLNADTWRVQEGNGNFDAAKEFIFTQSQPLNMQTTYQVADFAQKQEVRSDLYSENLPIRSSSQNNIKVVFDQSFGDSGGTSKISEKFASLPIPPEPQEVTVAYATTAVEPPVQYSQFDHMLGDRPMAKKAIHSQASYQAHNLEQLQSVCQASSFNTVTVPVHRMVLEIEVLTYQQVVPVPRAPLVGKFRQKEYLVPLFNPEPIDVELSPPEISVAMSQTAVQVGFAQPIICPTTSRRILSQTVTQPEVPHFHQ